MKNPLKHATFEVAAVMPLAFILIAFIALAESFFQDAIIRNFTNEQLSYFYSGITTFSSICIIATTFLFFLHSRAIEILASILSFYLIFFTFIILLSVPYTETYLNLASNSNLIESERLVLGASFITMPLIIAYGVHMLLKNAFDAILDLIKTGFGLILKKIHEKVMEKTMNKKNARKINHEQR